MVFFPRIWSDVIPRLWLLFNCSSSICFFSFCHGLNSLLQHIISLTLPSLSSFPSQCWHVLWVASLAPAPVLLKEGWVWTNQGSLLFKAISGFGCKYAQQVGRVLSVTHHHSLSWEQSYSLSTCCLARDHISQPYLQPFLDKFWPGGCEQKTSIKEMHGWFYWLVLPFLLDGRQ